MRASAISLGLCLPALSIAPNTAGFFAQVFRLYWRDPRYLEHMVSMMILAVRGVQEERTAQAAEKRAAEALLDGAEAPDFNEEHSGEVTRTEADVSLTMSSEERLRTLDFDQMGTSEINEAKRMIANLCLPVKPILSRRAEPSLIGYRVDPARTLRNAMHQGGEFHKIASRRKHPRWPNLLVFCENSGSTSKYSRMVLHFLHAVANEKGAGWAKVHAFAFGTRLTNISRHLHQRDVDAALAAAGAEAQDWEGGTRIGACLETFNRDWSRRVMGQGAVVLLITDGLDRDDPDRLAAQMKRLHLSARRLIWLKPLLRWEGFAPMAHGIAAMLPHVDSFRAGHSIASLQDLAAAISPTEDAGEKDRLMKYSTAEVLQATACAKLWR